MILGDRASALEYLGFNRRQTRFLVTVALHGGYCVRRHYAQVAGLSYGAGVRGFLDRLVARGLARRQTFRRDRGHVYHLHRSYIYEALGEAGNRNRRRASPALIARKLMLLDYVLANPRWTWLATETDKVDYFTGCGVPRWALPHRVYRGRGHREGTVTTERYFVHKLPIGLRPDDGAVMFVVLITHTHSSALTEFLVDHRFLLGRLRRWRVVALMAARLAGQPACLDAFGRFIDEPDQARSAAEREDLRFALPIFDRSARGDSLADVTIPELTRARHVRTQYGPEAFDRLRERWRISGESALVEEPLSAIRAALAAGEGRLETEWLPRRYDRFGSRAGVC